MQTQKEKVRAHLKRKGHITSWEAITEYRITRLAQWIYELRGEGMDIRSVYKTNKDGATYVVYRWENDDEKGDDDSRAVNVDRADGDAR